MSTRSSIGWTKTHHLYHDCSDNCIKLDDDRDQILNLMPENVWDEMQQQIISKWLMEVQNGYAKLNQVWDDPKYINRKTILENFKNLLEKVEK